MTLHIDPEIKGLIPPLSEDEYRQLEESILDEGCRDALVVWAGHNILVDGHNRYAICQQHGIPYQTIDRAFDNRVAVAEWMLRNQLGRRNLTDGARIKAVRRFKDMVAAQARERQIKAGELYGVSHPKEKLRINLSEAFEDKGRVREKLGEIAGVSGGKYEQGEYVADHAPDFLQAKWDAGDISTYRAYKLTKALQGLPDAVLRIVDKYNVDDVDTVPVLVRLCKQKADSFDDISLTGYIQPGDEHDAVHISAGVRAVEAALKLKSEVHKQLARDKRRSDIEAAADIAIESAPVVQAYRHGDRVQIGGHILLCGDNTSRAAKDLIASIPRPALAFCDPPYNAGAAAYDDGSFVWEQDYLCEVAEIVAVTPGISSIQAFMAQTAMPYRWSLSTHITNGMTRGALGFGNWLYTALFSQQDSLHRNRQDVWTVSISGQQLPHGDKRQKPTQYLAYLFELLTGEGDWIVDAFGGSGASVLVADRLGRRCVCIEKDPDTFAQMVANVTEVIGDKMERAA